MPVEPPEVINKQNLRNNAPPSEYASVKKSEKDGSLYIEMAAEDQDDGEKCAIEKITAKYDSLGRLRSSLEKLDIEDDEEENEKSQYDNYEEEEENGHRDPEKRNGSLADLADPTYRHTEISDQDLLQVESFFRSYKTTVYVCPTITNVYFSMLETKTLPDRKGSSGSPRVQSNWQLTHTGIPVLLLDSGETRPRCKRRIQILVAEKGTGFLLWRDTIDNLTNYKAVDSHFHTMFLSSDHRKIVGLSFSNVSAAREFYERIEELTADPANISLSVPNSKKAKKAASKKKKKVEKVRLPKKTDISQPCCFQHVTKVDLCDKDLFVTLATLTGKQRMAKQPPDGPSDNNELQKKFNSEPSLRKHQI